jgi:LIVCS family branched-chain amino acid:cation transporter
MGTQSLRKTVWVAGFAMFSMFFGSGNLVFPLVVGFETLDHYAIAALGFVVTAVLVPILGLLSMVLFKGDRPAFFDTLGKTPAFVITLTALALMGPFGVAPRCLTVAYGGLNLVMPSLELKYFAIFFCALVTLMIWKEGKVVDIIGKFLSPIKMGLIVALMICGLIFAPDIGVSTKTSSEAFIHALSQGYQTMDLVAAFFFSAATVHYIQSKHGDKNLMAPSLYASLIGASLLAIAYIVFTKIGASYALKLQNVAVEQMLVAVSVSALGAYAAPFVAATMAMATLVTAVILCALFANFLQHDIFKDKISRPVAIAATMVTTYGISLMGFGRITAFLGMILQTSYPALIALAIANIVFKKTGHPLAKPLFWSTLLVTLFVKWFS